MHNLNEAQRARLQCPINIEPPMFYNSLVLLSAVPAFRLLACNRPNDFTNWKNCHWWYTKWLLASKLIS